MGKTFEGALNAEGHKYGIVVGRFNSFIADRLLSGALDTLKRHGVREGDIDIAKVPGSFEIPLAAQKMAKSNNYNAIICLSVIIRGGTPHFDYVASEATRGIGHISLETGVPAIFGVVTADSIEQAIDRAGTKMGNKGSDAALAAIEMVNLLRQL